MLRRNLRDADSRKIGTTQCQTGKLHTTEAHIGSRTQAQMQLAADPESPPGNIKRHAHFSRGQRHVWMSPHQLLESRHDLRVPGLRLVRRFLGSFGEAGDDSVDHLMLEGPCGFGCDDHARPGVCHACRTSIQLDKVPVSLGRRSPTTHAGWEYQRIAGDLSRVAQKETDGKQHCSPSATRRGSGVRPMPSTYGHDLSGAGGDAIPERRRISAERH